MCSDQPSAARRRSRVFQRGTASQGRELPVSHRDLQLDAAHPALAWVAECFSDRSPRKVVGDVVVDRGYPFVLLVDLSSHKVTKTNEVELVEHLRRSAAVLGDTLCGRVVNKRRSMSKVLSELDSEVEKDFAADIASVRLKDVDREILDLFAS